ncbi:MAG: hypothetical protein J6K17_11985 [Oscillospiraceae bacterium]|nr:hypothetical protein [Oscillospiraceae bacterium]
MAFCRFCGNEVAEGETCACRAKSNGAGSKTVIIAAAAAVVVIALIVILIVSIGGSGYKKVLSDYETAIMEADAEAWYRTGFTDDMMETYEEYIDCYYDDSDEFWDEESEELEELLEGLEDEFGKNIKIKISVADKEALDEDDIEEIEDEYKDADYKIKIEKAYELECNVLVKGKDDSDDDDVDVIVFKTKDEGWKLHLDSIEEIMYCMEDMAE